MKKIIRKILREKFGYKQQLFDLLRTHNENNLEMVRMISQGQDINIIELLIEFFKENPKPPYFKLLKHFNLSEDELIYVLSEIYGERVTKKVYYNSIYDQNGNRIYLENSNGIWEKREYDENGNLIYYDDSNGNWEKYEYNENGKQIYYENYNGMWVKKEYDENDCLIYRKDSNGRIIDNR